MRPIDADKLRETIEDHVTTVSCCPTVDWSMGKTQFKKQCLEDIDVAPTVGGWISADKRPPKQGRYIVWGLTLVIPDHNDEPNGYWETKFAQWFEGIGWDCNVKFWQMLPDPPDEELT